DYKFFVDPIRVPQKYPDKKHWKGEKHGQLSSDPMGKNPGDVWAFRNVRHNHEEHTIHPAQFPEDLVERVVMATTEEGDVVLDPYMGVGTVALVARRLGRAYAGAESNAGYLEVARQRLSGNPDERGNFPNLRSLREYAEEQGLSDVSRFSFTRQVGAVATTRSKARILPEEEHLSRFIAQTEGEAEHPAHRRFTRAKRRQGVAAQVRNWRPSSRSRTRPDRRSRARWRAPWRGTRRDRRSCEC